METKSLRTEFTGIWEIFAVGLAVVYHVATLGRFIWTVKAPELLVKSVGLRVTVISFHEFFIRNFGFLDFFRV